MVQKYCPDFQHCGWGATTLQADDRQTDGWPMPQGERNVNTDRMLTTDNNITAVPQQLVSHFRQVIQ